MIYLCSKLSTGGLINPSKFKQWFSSLTKSNLKIFSGYFVWICLLISLSVVWIVSILSSNIIWNIYVWLVINWSLSLRFFEPFSLEVIDFSENKNYFTMAGIKHKLSFNSFFFSVTLKTMKQSLRGPISCEYEWIKKSYTWIKKS